MKTHGRRILLDGGAVGVSLLLLSGCRSGLPQGLVRGGILAGAKIAHESGFGGVALGGEQPPTKVGGS
jgi:hypothetical protein